VGGFHRQRRRQHGRDCDVATRRKHFMVRTVFLASLLAAASLLPVAEHEAPLADAAQARDLAAIQAQIRQKADPNRAQADGMTALHWAAENDDPAMTQVLLNAGAKPDVETRLGAITPLFIASKNANPAIVEALLKAGANAGAVD